MVLDTNTLKQENKSLSMEGTEITITAGKWNGRIYNMTVHPNYTKLENTEDIEENFHVSINIYYRENGEEHEIARIDNSHDYMHIHRLYTSQENDKEEINLSYWESVDYLRENLTQFARLYDENHR
jgi:hypothetical protein